MNSGIHSEKREGTVPGTYEVAGRSADPAVGNEIGQPLGRRHLCAAPGPPGGLLEVTAELQSGQLAPLPAQMLEIGQPHFRHDTRISPPRIAPRRGHAVHDTLRRVGHGRYDDAARTHTERVDTPSAHLGRQGIGGRGQVFASGTVILYLVDESLRMLYPDAHGERLGLQQHPLPVEHRVDIVRRVARGQHHAAGLYPLTAAHHAGYGVPVQQQLRHPTAEPHFAAAGGDCPADGGHDTGQPVGTDMRMGFIEYRLVGTVEDERTERLVVISALLAPGKELAVGKGTRTSFAEGIVGVGVEPAVAVQFCHVAAAYRHLPAPFEDDGPVSRFDEPQRTEEAGRASAHDDDLLGMRHVRIVEADLRSGPSPSA